MRKFTIPVFFACLIAAPNVLANSETATMDVSLNNIPVVNVTTSPINFGDVPETESNPTASGSITVNASAGLVYNIAIDGGANPNTQGSCRAMLGIHP